MPNNYITTDILKYMLIGRYSRLKLYKLVETREDQHNHNLYIL